MLQTRSWGGKPRRTRSPTSGNSLELRRPGGGFPVLQTKHLMARVAGVRHGQEIHLWQFPWGYDTRPVAFRAATEQLSWAGVAGIRHGSFSPLFGTARI